MTGTPAPIRLATPGDLKLLMTGLANLARDLGDPFRATPDGLRAALFGRNSFAFAQLAKRAGDVTGVALCSASYSTFLGGPALYVSDLWVAQSTRGTGLGRALLRASMREGERRWQAAALRLLVYAENASAQAFYRHIGFDIIEKDKTAMLSGDALRRLMEPPA